MKRSSLVLLGLEIIFLFFSLYVFSYDINWFPWFKYSPDRWGAGMILIFLLLIYLFLVLITFFFPSDTKDKKTQLGISSMIAISILFQLYYNTEIAQFGYFMLFLLSLLKVRFWVKNFFLFH